MEKLRDLVDIKGLLKSASVLAMVVLIALLTNRVGIMQKEMTSLRSEILSIRSEILSNEISENNAYLEKIEEKLDAISILIQDSRP